MKLKIGGIGEVVAEDGGGDAEADEGGTEDEAPDET